MESLSPFQTVLAARRERYNAQFRLARQRNRTLDAQEFLTHLRDVVGPVVDSVGAKPTPVADALVELSLELAARGRLNRSGGGVADGLRRLVPALSEFLAADPRRLPASVLNALHHLDISPTGDPAAWIDTMIEIADRLDPADGASPLLDAGVVAAWRCGLAQLRAAALETARRVRPNLLSVAFATRSTVDSAVLDRLADDPWLDPAIAGADRRLLLLARRVGGFRGFGGTFTRPPLVSTSDGRWYATDGDGCWRVFADRFGVSLRRVAAIPAGETSGPLVLADGGVVSDTATGATLELPELTDATSWAASGGTLAATTPWTHGILFVARTVG